MSEKHLTEPPWKTLVTKQGVKDLGLGKALAAYSSVDPTKEPAKALEGLKEIADLAAKLKKANPTKEDVVAHLDEVVKEVKKTTPALEARVKSVTAAATAAEVTAKLEAAAQRQAKPAGATKPVVATQTAAEDEKEQEEEEEKEAAAFKKNLKQQMVSALAQVKARAPGEPEQQKDPKPQLQFMAYLAGKNCAVIVGRKVGSATKKLLPEIAGGASGGQIAQGECIFEKNAHTFVLAKVPGGLAKKLATALQAETGQKYKVRVRNVDGSVTLDSDTDVAPDATPTTGPDEMAKFTARYKALQPDLIKAIGAKTPQSYEAKQRATEAVALAKGNDFAKAHQLLDQVESLFKQGGAPGGAGNLLVVWKEAKDTVDAQLEQLYVKLRMSRLAALHRAASKIEAVLGNFRTALVIALTEYDQASGANREKARAKALQVVTSYQTNIPQDKLIIAADTNPFGLKVTVRQTLGGALATLSTRLAAS